MTTMGSVLGEVVDAVRPSLESVGYVEQKPIPTYGSGYVEAEHNLSPGFVEAKPPSRFHVGPSYIQTTDGYGTSFVEAKPHFSSGFVELGLHGEQRDLPTRTMPPVYDGLKYESVI